MCSTLSGLCRGIKQKMDNEEIALPNTMSLKVDRSLNIFRFFAKTNTFAVISLKPSTFHVQPLIDSISYENCRSIVGHRLV